MQSNSNSRLVIILTHLAVIFTVFSQILELQSRLRPLMFGCWCIALIYALIAKRALYINSYIKTFALSMLFVFIHNVICFFVYDRIQLSNYLRNPLIPLFVFFTMFQVAGYINAKQFRNLLATYCACSVILAIYIYINYIPSLDNWLESQVYIYEAKNSAAQIFSSTVIILLLFFKDADKRFNIIKYGIVAYLLMMIIMLQCRTALLGLIVALAYYFLIKASNKQRIYFFIILLFLFLIVISSDKLSEIFIHAFNFDKYDNPDLNDLSSGRIDLYKLALARFTKSPFLGTVSYYVDCMYISLYTALGIFAGSAVLIPWFKRISRNSKSLRFAKKHKADSNLETTVFYMTIFYFVSSLFEGLPPFGPGACSAMFWLCCAYMDYTYYKPAKDTFVSIEEKVLAK